MNLNPPSRRFLIVLVVLAALSAACDRGAPPAADPTDAPTAASPDDAPASAGPDHEVVLADLWVSPDGEQGVVRMVIEDPIRTRGSAITLTGDLLRNRTDARLLVDGEPRELQGRGLIPWEFGRDRHLDLEVSFPITPAKRWEVDGQMLDGWLPFRIDPPRYFSRVTWDVQIHAPVAARIGGDPRGDCTRDAPGGRDAEVCVATRDIGTPPLVYLPAPDEPVRASGDGYVVLVGDLDAGTAEDLLGFADGAVQRLNAIVGDVAPRQVVVLMSDVVGNFVGEAQGPMVVFDRAFVAQRPGSARELLAHELVHTAQEHRLSAPGRDPGQGLTESLAEYVGKRMVHGDDVEVLRSQVRDRRVSVAELTEVEGLTPRDAFGRRPPIGQDELISVYEYQRRALVYSYLPRAWVDLHAHLGTEEMDRFLRELHTRVELDWNIDQVFELAGEFDAEAASILRRYWEEPIPSDQEAW